MQKDWRARRAADK